MDQCVAVTSMDSEYYSHVDYTVYAWHLFETDFFSYPVHSGRLAMLGYKTDLANESFVNSQ